MQYKPHNYQAHATAHLITNPEAGLFLDMGLGKTVSTLTAIAELLDDYAAVRVLVIAPLEVAKNTWTGEIAKWDHLKHLRVSKVLGTERQRINALQTKADIYIINCENVAWLTAFYSDAVRWPFDLLVIDELSKFKNPQSLRFKALRKMRPVVKRVWGLTGTPAPNGLIDLWAQLFLLDRGQRLGPTVGGYRERFFKPDKRQGDIVYSYKPKNDTPDTIHELIKDICISMRAEDYLDLPGRLVNDIVITMAPDLQKRYDDFEEAEVMELANKINENGVDFNRNIVAANAAALANKLLQFANGAVYDDDKVAHHVHDLKLDALDEIVDTAQGKPVLVFYAYQSDRDRITERFKKLKPQNLKGPNDVENWNAGNIPFALVHAASAGHGLNLQNGGNIIVWFGLPWSLELYQQGNARLDRQGQKEVVIIHRLLVRSSMDEDVAAALENKADGQNKLMDAVKARVEKYLENAKKAV